MSADQQDELVAAVQKALVMLEENDLATGSELISLALATNPPLPIKTPLRRAKENIRLHLLESAKYFLEAAFKELTKE